MDADERSAQGEAAAAELLELGDAFLELDRDWRIVRVNRNQEALSRKPRSETLGRTFWEVWPEAARPDTSYWREYRRCMEQRVPVKFVDHYAPLDLWTAVTAYPTSRGGIAVFFRDVSDAMKAEGALRESEERFRSVFECAAAGIGRVGLDGRFLEVNERYAEIVGYPVPELMRLTFQAITHPDDLDADLDQVAALLRGEIHRYNLVKRYLRKDGAVVWVSMSVGLARDRSGRPSHFAVVVEDITSRRRAEEAQARLASIVEGTDDAIISKDLAGVILTWNAGAERLFGYRADEVIGRPIALLLPPGRQREEDDILRQLRAGGRVEHFETERLRKDGTVVAVSVSVSPVRDGAGHIVAASKIARDVTERKRVEAALRAANERLVEADRRKDEFLGMLSHELRNPLAPIRHGLYILERTGAVGEAAARARDIIARQVVHMTRLVDDLLDVTRVARGKIDLRPTDLDVAEVVRRTGEDYRALAQQRGVELEVRTPSEPVLVHGDQARLAQVIGNLLHNAAKFTGEGGHVSLALARFGEAAEISVRDTGVGIEPGLLGRVFEPFTQAEQTLARSEGGLGLGLALVKGLVELHGGAVAVASEGKGRGAEFRVRLPLATPSRRTPTAAPGAPPAPQRRRRVLVVDDNEDAADSLAEVVGMFGHEVEVAHDGRTAVERARAHQPDVVLCDIGLPGMSGYDVARAIRASGATGMQLVAVSGYAQPEDVKRAIEAGFDAHMAKPADPESIDRLLA